MISVDDQNRSRNKLNKYYIRFSPLFYRLWKGILLIRVQGDWENSTKELCLLQILHNIFKNAATGELHKVMNIDLKRDTTSTSRCFNFRQFTITKRNMWRTSTIYMEIQKVGLVSISEIKILSSIDEHHHTSVGDNSFFVKSQNIRVSGKHILAAKKNWTDLFNITTLVGWSV